MITPNMLKPLLCLVTFTLISCESGNKPTVSVSSAPEVVSYKPAYTTEKGSVQRGQGLFQALKGVSIENALALQLINALRDEVEFSKLKVGDTLEATYDENKNLISFAFSQNPAEKHLLNLDPITNTWNYSFKEEPTVWQTRILEGELRAGSTLHQDLQAQGLSNSVVGEIVNVLLCKVNFRFHARMGDKYKVLLKERKFHGDILETKVLYTAYDGVRAGKSSAYFFEDDEKKSTFTAHYTEEGEALIPSGLRYPVKRLHIRSNYGWRVHPVTGLRAMHSGVDFRGRVGEPVHAVAHGRVVDSSYNIFAGNKIAIKHADGSVSYYLHLNDRRVKKGDIVKSYQIIGGVGATGRVTGPHLHFGFKQANGKWMDPMNKRMIATPKLEGEKFARLQEQIASHKALIDNLEISRIARYIAAEIPNQEEESLIDIITNLGSEFMTELEPKA